MGQARGAFIESGSAVQRVSWDLRRALVPGLFFFVVGGNLLEILGFEDLIAVLASQVIDPVTAHQKFRALMLTARHKEDYPYSKEGALVVKP